MWWLRVSWTVSSASLKAKCPEETRRGGDDLFAFFETHYQGVLYVPLVAYTPQQLVTRLGEF